LFVVGADADVKFGEFGGKGLVVDQQLAQADEPSNRATSESGS
jgi:hypothetical protein